MKIFSFLFLNLYIFITGLTYATKVFSKELVKETISIKNTESNDTSISTDYLKPGWDTNSYKWGLGYTSSLLDGNAFALERYIDDTYSHTYFLGWYKSADTYSASDIHTVSSTGSTVETNKTAYLGVRYMPALSMGMSYNKKFYKNDWITIRAGLFAGIDYYFNTKYYNGTKQVSSNSATPGTIDVVETGY